MFVRTLRSPPLNITALCATTVLTGAAFLCFPEAVYSGVCRGLSLCGSVLIPGLFPFLVLANFVVKSGVCSVIGTALEKLITRLFYLPGCCGVAILISLIGVYPAGAITVGELYREGRITQTEARRLLHFCVNAGPAFIISTVGVGLLGSVRCGLLLYAAHVAVALLIGIADGVRARVCTRSAPPKHAPAAHAAHISPGTALPLSINTACMSLLSMCGFVLLSSALLSLLDAAGITQLAPLNRVLPGLLEVSCGCVEVAHAAGMPLWLGTVLGFGGLSVHGQIAATLSDTPLIRSDFFAARLWQALLSGLLTALLFRIVPGSTAVLLPLNETIHPSLSGSAAGACALLLMCGLFLLATQHETAP